MTTVALDVEAVRARFSALQVPTAFLDGPGGTQCPDSVVDAIAGYLRESNANVGGSFGRSRRGRARVGRRGALRATRADRRGDARRRRAHLLAVQVLRAASRAGLRPRGAARAVAPVQGAPRGARAARAPLRDGDARARAP